jgi:uncharacterized protein
MMAQVMALATGLVFALGLGLSGMTNPAKVIAFLDVGADWDPSLALVMGGALAVHGLFLRLFARPAPYLAARFDGPERSPVGAGLLLGAALFGLGWGASGFCPGPAIVSLVTLAPSTLLFVAGMLVGIVLVSGWQRLRGGSEAADGSPAA